MNANLVKDAAMSSKPEAFSDESGRVLRVVLDSGIIRGFELQRRAGLESAEALKAAAMPLLNQNLITVSGMLVDSYTIERAQFAPLPSAQQTARFLLK